MKRILLVDDDENFCFLTREILTRQGYFVDMAHSAMDAQIRLAISLPDMILLDIMMPELNGLALCRVLRSSPLTQNIPVMMVSALGDSKTIDEAMRSGAADYMVKPVNPEVMFQKIEKALAGAKNNSN